MAHKGAGRAVSALFGMAVAIEHEVLRRCLLVLFFNDYPITSCVIHWHDFRLPYLIEMTCSLVSIL